MNKIPYLRICVTEKCKHKCLYCRSGGEACRVIGKKEMSLKQIKSLVEMMALHGISDLKITGGEPFTRNDIPEMVEQLLGVKGIKRIEIVTRSHKAGLVSERLRINGLSCLNFSLDSLNPSTFRRITGNDELDKLLIAIRKCANSGIKLKFNMVVMKGLNDHEIPKLIEFAGEFKAVLKLLDLMNMPQETNFLSKYYMPLDAIEKELEGIALRSSTLVAPGGLGTPMPTFEIPNGAVVMIKDARKGTWYGDTCKGCKYYKCQDALMALRITSDGCLQRCLLRDDNLIDLLSMIENGMDRASIDLAIKTALKTYESAEFHKEAWKYA